MVDDPVTAHVRTLCLSFPEASENSAWGHPNFRAGDRTFVAVEPIGGRLTIAFRLTPMDVERLRREPGFTATPYGRGQWVSLLADGAVDWTHVATLAERSYRLVALKRMIKALDGNVPRKTRSV
jgi:predicted DNA-binding protein (MmcQ/YjbR family)